VLFDGLCLAFVLVHHTGIKGDSSSEVPLKTFTAAFANDPRDSDANNDEDSDTNEGKDADLQGRVLQERGGMRGRRRRSRQRAGDIDDASTIMGGGGGNK